MNYRMVQCAAAVACSLSLAIPASAVVAAPTPGKWQLVGKTYNSVMLLDLSSAAAGATKLVRVMRVSGQPGSDGWRSVSQQIRVGCADKSFADKGSTIEKFDGSRAVSPPAMKSTTAPTRGVYAELFKTVCQGSRNIVVADPIAWTRLNFKPGD